MESPSSFSVSPAKCFDVRLLDGRPGLAGPLLAVAVVCIGMLAMGCGGVPDLDEAWRELRDPRQATDSVDPDRRLLLARMVLEESTMPSGARARFPLGFPHLVEHLSAGAADASHYSEFDRLAQAITAGRRVRAEFELDVPRVTAGERVALEQQVTLHPAGASIGSGAFLWIPERAPGFPEGLELRDLRVEIAQPGGGWTRIRAEPQRVAIVGPAGFAAPLPAETERVRVIYGVGDGFSMPPRSGNHRLPLWLGAENGVVFLLGGAELEVGPATPAEVQLEGPSVVRPGEVFALELRRTDRFGNVVEESVRPAMELWLEDRAERRFPAGDGNRLMVGGLSRSEPGVVRYRVEAADGLVGWSAPILVREEGPRLLWADPAVPSRLCSAADSGLNSVSCVTWAGCQASFPGDGNCRAAADVGAEGAKGGEHIGTLWLERVRFGGSIRDDWRAGLGRFGVDDPLPGTLALASLELLESGAVRTAVDWAFPEVALLGSAVQPSGPWPGELVVARSAVTAIWSERPVEGSSSLPSDSTSNHYATSGARMLIDCRRASSTFAETGAMLSPRCAIHGTAPVWRIDVLLPSEGDDGAAGSATQTWRSVEELRPLQTQERALMVVSWSVTSEGARRPAFAEGELSVADGEIVAAALFGTPLESARLGLDGLLFRQVAPPTRGGLLVDLGTAVPSDQRIRLSLRIEGRDEIVDFLVRQVPFRRPLESGWIEAEWVAERAVLDLEPVFSDLTPADAERAVVLVQQIDGEVGIARFHSNP